MTGAAAFLPLVAFVLAACALLFVTAPDRRARLSRLRATVGAVAAPRRRLGSALGPATPRRAVQAVVVLLLVAYVWTYQSIKSEIRVLLEEHELEGVRVDSLVMPYTAFFRADYAVDAGFSRTKLRTRADVAVTGRPWSGLDASISEIELAKIGKIVGRTFEFSFLSDVEVLKPAIREHMGRLEDNKRIDAFEIETFDNRGPYVLVVLAEKHRGGDVAAAATEIAEGLYTNLTKVNELKVNRVVVKVVDPDLYASSGRIKVLGRGTAGRS